jgi:hypothetical protein
LAELAGLHIADPPERWSALGFAVSDAQVALDRVRLQLGVPGSGITAWSVRGVDVAVDGLPVAPIREGVSTYAPIRHVSRHALRAAHPNGAVAVDHVVVTTPEFERTRMALAGAGVPLKRVIEMRGTRMGFRRIGPAILELVEAPGQPLGFWGLVVTVNDLDALADRLGEHLGPIKPAVQPGRRIATVRPSAGLTTNLAFMDPEPR